MPNVPQPVVDLARFVDTEHAQIVNALRTKAGTIQDASNRASTDVRAKMLGEEASTWLRLAERFDALVNAVTDFGEDG